ncbi:MAG: hypothetical protein H0X37_03180 [Herpetosiphonaceae bacterium]|nr:hypothetical protein [Herpetosiphonaceae bacterium]
MQLELLPLLHVQRELYTIPLGWTRFHTYIETMTGGTDDIILPLVGMNPMGNEHISALLDTLIGFDAEAVATAALTEAVQRLTTVDRQFRVALIVSDDLRGGWTNRYFSEMQSRFEMTSMLKRHWIITTIWTSETWSPEKVRAEVLAQIYRAAYTQCFGLPKTLRQMLRQEGLAALFAATEMPELVPDELAYSREVIQPHLDTTEYPTIFACLFGDEAASSAGYPPLGLSPRAGYAVALTDAQREQSPPEALLGARADPALVV